MSTRLTRQDKMTIAMMAILAPLLAFIFYMHVTTPLMADEQRYSEALLDVQYQQGEIRKLQLEKENLQLKLDLVNNMAEITVL